MKINVICTVASIIINIRYTLQGPMGLCSHSGLYRLLDEYTESSYDKHTITTEIRSGYYIYTLERPFCLIINIMINIRYISRCVMQISKSVRFILHALSSDYRFSSVHVKNLTPTALQEDARARCRCERLPLNMHALS